ncbi:MAG: hypothetical protein PHT07_04975 [Paludibacter sp.]|nr:hypothetical protein [Paludibacter sp.]
MATSTIIPDAEMRNHSLSCLEYANGFYSAFQKSLNNKNSRFNNDLLYDMAVLSHEKYFVALMARYDWHASHHMPIALYKEALDFDSELTDSMKQTSILVGKFEAICSLEGFGYRTPSTEELHAMALGIQEIKELVEKRAGEIC